MVRIYFGRVGSVEIPNGKDAAGNPLFEPVGDWDKCLWAHHELFQDAVNYYTLGLAAMAKELKPDSPKGKAALAWREQVRENWLWAQRKADRFPGPHRRLAPWLSVDVNEKDSGKAFDLCAKALLKSSPASGEALAQALLQMLEEVDQADMNQFCVSRLPWLCTPHGQLDATPKNVVQQQEKRMLETILKIHSSSEKQLPGLAQTMDLGCFVTQMPKEQMSGEEARSEALRLFNSALKKNKSLAAVLDSFSKYVDRLGDKLVLPRLGRKPKGTYPFAVAFKLYPVAETWEALKKATASMQKKAEKAKDVPVEIAVDYIAQARTESDKPVFDYFTNRVLFREPGNEDRAVWFDFDLAAFIEAIKSPHRYFEDTITREKDAEELRRQMHGMEGRGWTKQKTSESDEDEEAETFGFEKDERIRLLKEIVQKNLRYLSDAEDPESQEYTIRERTLRGFAEVKEQWCKMAQKGKPSEENLLKVLAAHQTKHRDDFGSAVFFQELAMPIYHPIWHDPGTEEWHASDPLKAWREYKELGLELADKERKIRFTPAHPEFSPRYFIIPKQGRLGTDHTANELAFTCGMAMESKRGWEALEVRICYSAPRLLRDEIRHTEREDLEAVPWLQPMMQSLGVADLDTQDFSNCRVTLQPRKLKPKGPEDKERINIQLNFPVDVKCEKLISAVKQALASTAPPKTAGEVANPVNWENQFNGYYKGDDSCNMSLRWPHEKQPTKPVEPWYRQTQSFRCVAVDLGQRDAGAFARVLASCNKKDWKEKKRFIGKPGEENWYAMLERSGMFRLPGEDAQVWRAISKKDRDNPQDSNKAFDYREELWGERGRRAQPWEITETEDLMRHLEAVETDENGQKKLSLLPDEWKEKLTFPEQNDKLLIAFRRYLSRVSMLHRWCWFLAGDEAQQSKAWGEIEKCEDPRLIPATERAAAKKKDPRIATELASRLRQMLRNASDLLVQIANRVLPLRNGSWHWEKHPVWSKENPLYCLTQNGPALGSADNPVRLRGQRGLSIERIRQIEELRQRCQALNQLQRREIGGKPPTRRDESVPDPCPDILKKLDRIKKQRVNQTAHFILAEALGLHLTKPRADKPQLLQEKDLHGVYEQIKDKQGRWIGPVDFVVIEYLSSYRTTQARAPKENVRLMNWCQREVRQKIKQLCEVFGLPVVETPPADSSRFCARSGVPGFRAVEVSVGFENKAPWSWIKGKKETKNGVEIATEEAAHIQKLVQDLNEAQKIPTKSGQTASKPRTLLAPINGGPIFIPIVDNAPGAEIQPAVVQADINAAVNLAFRAISDPRIWAIHPRVRSKRGTEPGCFVTDEKRKFGMKNPPKLHLEAQGEFPESTTNPSFFADLADLKQVAEKFGLQWMNWAVATLDTKEAEDRVTLLHTKTIWGIVKQAQWKRVEEINRQRIMNWKEKDNPMPD